MVHGWMMISWLIHAGMGLWTLLEGFLLLANALAILNEDRFLAPRRWSFSEVSSGKTKSLKGQVIGLIYAVQYLRVPLIALNTLTIVVMLVSGWSLDRKWMALYDYKLIGFGEWLMTLIWSLDCILLLLWCESRISMVVPPLVFLSFHLHFPMLILECPLQFLSLL